MNRTRFLFMAKSHNRLRVLRNWTVALTCLSALPAWAQDSGSSPETEASEVLDAAVGETTAEATAEGTAEATAEATVAEVVVRGADAAPRAPRGATWDVRGLARYRYNRQTDHATDLDGTRHGRSSWMESRVVVGAGWRPIQRLGFELELDAVNGQFAGDSTEVGQTIGADVFRVERSSSTSALSRVAPRRAYVQWDSPWFRMVAGAQTFGWGTGFLANDGIAESDFGDAWQGNLVARLLVATQPFRNMEQAGEAARSLTLVLAGDRVIEDDNGSWYEGDDIWAGVFGVRMETPTWSVGVFEAVRSQTDRPDPLYPADRRTSVLANTTDLWARWRVLDAGSQSLTLETESALIMGSTDRPWLDETWEDGAQIRAFGGLFRVRYDHQDLDLTAKIEAGYASGDNDPRDAVSRQFSFNSDYNVGLILFDQVMPMLTARAGDRLFDPNLVAVPPSGVRFTVAQGGVTNAGYVNPVLRYRPVEGLDLRLGYVWAVSASDLTDVYQTARNGGYPTGFDGVQGGARGLGHEVDVSARYTITLPGSVGVRLGVENGIFLPGNALSGLNQGAGIPTLVLTRATFDLTW